MRTPAAESTPAPVGLAPGESAVILARGTVARYRVRETLANVGFPTDAVGETSQVSGAFVFDRSGAVLPDLSVVTMSAQSLRSDQARRDNYLSGNAIQTRLYPTVTFALSAVPGLEWPLPGEGNAEFQMEGNLTVRSVTKPVIWQVRADLQGDKVTGVAMTEFAFGYFGMQVPRLFFILGVEDEIRLELDFVGTIVPGG